MSHEGIRIVNAEQARQEDAAHERASRSTGKMDIGVCGILHGCGMHAHVRRAMKTGKRPAGCQVCPSLRNRRC
jgi:hypothetical protein